MKPSMSAVKASVLGCLLILGVAYGYHTWRTDHEPVRYVISFPLTADITAHTDHAHTPDAPRSAWMYHEEVVPFDMAVTGIRAVVKNAPSEIIHHLSLVSVGLPDAVCGSSTHANQREYFTVSRSNIRDAVTFERPYALPITQGERLSLEVMTHVLDAPYGPGGTYPDATIDIELTYEEPTSEAWMPVSFVRLRLDDTECGEPLMHQAFVVPEGSGVFTRYASTTSGESSDTYTFTRPGVMFARSANVWGTKGGRSLEVLKNDAWLESYAAVRGDEPWQWTIASKTEPIDVIAGDTISIAAQYEQSTSTTILDASGIFGFYFAPTPSR